MAAFLPSIVAPNDTCVSDGPYRVSRAERQTAQADNAHATIRTRSVLNFEVAEVNAGYGIFPTHKNYGGGVTSHIYFMVSEPIKLTKLFFYGPKAVTRGQGVTYTVQVDIYQGIFTRDRAVRAANVRERCLGTSDAFLEVNIRDALYIRNGCWYTVEFILSGPDTLRMSGEPKGRTSVFVPGHRGVDFKFLRGSLQLPEMEFHVVSPWERRTAELQWHCVDVMEAAQQRNRLNVFECFWSKLSACFV